MNYGYMATSHRFSTRPFLISTVSYDPYDPKVKEYDSYFEINCPKILHY